MATREVGVQFQIGDQVIHPVHGVGTVKTLTEQQFGVAPARSYYEVATPRGPTVWVPIDEQGHTVLRRIASKACLAECRGLLLEDPIPFNSDRPTRQVEISTRLKGGLLPALATTVRDLRARSRGVPLGATENALLKRISKALCDEWAASKGITIHAAEREVEELLLEGGLSTVPEVVARKQPKREAADA
jgi:CarD family transcriptional regulator